METDFAWAAGIVDGEGTLSMTRIVRREENKKIIRCVFCVANTDLRILNRLKKIFGGSIYRRTPPKKHNLDYFVWRPSDVDIKSILICLLPYLVGKRKQAKLLLALRESVDSGKLKGRKWMVNGRILPKDVYEEREELLIRVQALKRGGNYARVFAT